MPPSPEKRPGGPERLLLEEDPFSLTLFGMLNPVLDSMRGLCAASHLERVQDEGCGRQVSLGSFSGAKVELGDQWQGEPVRVVRVEVDGKQLLLATDLEIEAELIALI